MQRLARDPELGRHHGLGFATLDRQHGTVALFDNRQVDQSQSRPPSPSTSDGERKVDQAPTSSISWDRRVKNQPGPHKHYELSLAEFASMGIE
jgi:hypothetical protein